MPLTPKRKTRGKQVLDKPRNPSGQVDNKAEGARQAKATRKRGELQRRLRAKRKREGKV